MIELRDIRVEKTGSTICQVEEWKVKRGEKVAVSGANGSGKSTLLRVLAGLEETYSGSCHIHGSPRNRVYVHQVPYLFRGTVLHNVSWGLAARGMAKRSSTSVATGWLEKLGVETLSARNVETLSGGERRRVALARALAVDPELLLLDEPLADLDELGIDAVCSVLQALVTTTVVIASPIPLPEGLCDHNLLMRGPSRIHR